MFRIRKIYDGVSPGNRRVMVNVRDILRERFPDARPEDVDNIPTYIKNPVSAKFKAILFVAEDASERLLGFAVMYHMSDLHFTYLDFVAATPAVRRRGVGEALYNRVREEAQELGDWGVLFECLPDDDLRQPDFVLKDNQARLKFYERFGVFPVMDTAYQKPMSANSTDAMPFLMLDALGARKLPQGSVVRRAVQAILKRKYGSLCPPAYIRAVVRSVSDGPVRLRPPRYVQRADKKSVPSAKRKRSRQIRLVVNDMHALHHVRERGYVESPVRIAAIMKSFEKTDLFCAAKPRVYDERHIRAVHSGKLVNYLKEMSKRLPEGKVVYPYVFPIRNPARPPDDLPTQAGYYCIDTFTPLSRVTYKVAKRCVDCTLTAADAVLDGHWAAYALVRPPGHHAEYDLFGGFCYFNNNAVAAHYLSRHGKVAILDIDYHHGNGQQDIFYQRDDVLTVSLHGHPRHAYPYFTGFPEERGAGKGKGFNINYALPEQLSPGDYIATLEKALARIRRFNPDYMVVALGYDTARGDPTGTWTNTPSDFQRIGELIGRFGKPMLVVQEGGYLTHKLGNNAVKFFHGLHQGYWQGKDGA
ncbi:MAG: histone deacetylase family protein [Pseudomonadaceae bacterium]|nr:histone deacetylase family protein [Pseudomonadaceae bacterium]